jgi:sugar phosphate isomerase/epimerase
MRELIHKYFLMGIIQWMSFPRTDMLESIREIACDDFFDAVEVCGFKDDETRVAAKKLLSQSHLKVCYGAQPRLLGSKLNPNDLDEEQRKGAEQSLLKAVDEAEYLGAKAIAFLAGKWVPETKEQSYVQLLKTTRTVCGYAADIDKAALIGPAPLAARFAADMRTTHNNFGLLVDLSHFPITYETSKFVIHTLRPYITHFHLGNAVIKPGCEAYGDQHPRFGFPNGANDVAELADYFQVLKDEGFYCTQDPFVLSLEVKPRGDEDEGIVLANTKRVINRAWALVND